MKIINYKIYQREIRLDRPFKTALRTVNIAKELVFELETEGFVGIGAAPPTEVITGDNLAGIKATLENQIWPKLRGQNPEELNHLLNKISGSAVNNTSAKAAAEIALFDLVAKINRKPLWQFLGGSKRALFTDHTVSVDEPDVMAEAARDAVAQGFKILKLKVGVGPEIDLARVEAVGKAVGPEIKLRLDANQGWTVKEAINTIKKLEAADYNLELVEQPVAASDYKGLKEVKDKVLLPVMADESLFSLKDAVQLLEMQACDLLNIKLMKTGGISTALAIARLAKAYNIECMLGSMLESRISVTAAAAVALASENITRFDLDAPILIGKDGVEGGLSYNNDRLELPDEPGLGIGGIKQ